MKGADFSLNTFCRHLATDATVMTVQIGLMLHTLVAKPATRQHTTKERKQNEANARGGSTDWILQTTVHLRSENVHVDLSNASAELGEQSLLQVTQHGLILYTSNTDFSGDEPLM